jgi:hypothetical protein
MKFKRSSGQHFVASITHRKLCAETLVVVCVGQAGLPGPGSSAPQEQSRWGGNEVRARGGNGGRRGRAGGLGDAHGRRYARQRTGTTPSTWKLRRCAAPHAARISLKGRCVAGPRGSVCGELTDPGSDSRDPSLGRWSFSEFHITQWL